VFREQARHIGTHHLDAVPPAPNSLVIVLDRGDVRERQFQAAANKHLIGVSLWPVRFRMTERGDELRSTLSLTLIVCLLPFPAAAHETSPGPIAAAIPLEAAQLNARQDAASETGNEHQDTLTLSSWSRVRRLAPETKRIVTVKGEQPRRWRFGTADASQLTVHDSTGHEETIAHSDVAVIETFAIRGSKAGAIGGAAVGAFFGVGFAIGLALNTRCQPSCGGVETRMALLAIGMPVAAGFGGFYAFGKSRARVIYRAP
jgi:hypothetical protein